MLMGQILKLRIVLLLKGWTSPAFIWLYLPLNYGSRCVVLKVRQHWGFKGFMSDDKVGFVHDAGIWKGELQLIWWG